MKNYTYTKAQLETLQQCIQSNPRGLSEALKTFFNAAGMDPTPGEILDIWIYQAEAIIDDPGYIEKKFAEGQGTIQTAG